MLEFIIPGEIVPTQSVRVRIVHTKDGREFLQFYQLVKIKKYKAYVVETVTKQLSPDFILLEGPLRMSLIASFPIPSWMTKNLQTVIDSGGIVYKHTKPDITDNILKGFIDALQGVLYKNDSQISIIGAMKIYERKPKVKITIEQLPVYKGGTLL